MVWSRAENTTAKYAWLVFTPYDTHRCRLNRIVYGVEEKHVHVLHDRYIAKWIANILLHTKQMRVNTNVMAVIFVAAAGGDGAAV